MIDKRSIALCAGSVVNSDKTAETFRSRNKSVFESQRT